MGTQKRVIEQLKKDLLSKEGLFDTEKKKKLPYLPRLIGVITWNLYVSMQHL